jgi:hypothetical protein
VDHVFLTDNNSRDSLAMHGRLRKLFPDYFLTIRNELEPRAQLKTYAWCAEELRAMYNWIAFVDIDEYLVLRKMCGSMACAVAELSSMPSDCRCRCRWR